MWGAARVLERTGAVRWSALMGLGRSVDVALQAAQRGLGAGDGLGSKRG